MTTVATKTTGKFTNIYGGHGTGKTYELERLFNASRHLLPKKVVSLKIGNLARYPLTTVFFADEASQADKPAIKRLLKAGYAVVAASLEPIVID